MKKITIVILAALAGCSTVQEVHRGRIHHVVLCWLKDSGNAAQRDQIMDVSRSFRTIPGVLDVCVGEVIESDRRIVDDSFDVAITLSFANIEDLEAYLVHPTHQKAADEVLFPVVKKVVVYDFKELQSKMR